MTNIRDRFLPNKGDIINEGHLGTLQEGVGAVQDIAREMAARNTAVMQAGQPLQAAPIMPVQAPAFIDPDHDTSYEALTTGATDEWWNNSVTCTALMIAEAVENQNILGMQRLRIETGVFTYREIIYAIAQKIELAWLRVADDTQSDITENHAYDFEVVPSIILAMSGTTMSVRDVTVEQILDIILREYSEYV